MCAAWPWPHKKDKTMPAKKVQNVIIRSSGSGVWFGQLVEHDRATRHVVIRDGRRVWSWEGAASCSGLASHGPRDGKIVAPVIGDSTIADVLEVLPVTVESVDRFAKVAPWVA